MKKNKLIRALGLMLALIMLVCAAPSGAAFADAAEEIKDADRLSVPLIKAVNIYADEAMTEKISDLSTLKAGVRYWYTLECEPGEMLKSVGIAAKEADDKSFVAPCDGKAGFTLCEKRVIRPGDVDLDESFNAKDVTSIMKHLVGIRVKQNAPDGAEMLGYHFYNLGEMLTDNADVNLDGKINARDVIALMKAIVSKSPVAPKVPGGVQSGFEVKALAGVGGITIPSSKEAEGDVSVTVTDRASLESRIPGELDGIEKTVYSHNMPFIRSFFGLDGEVPAKSALVDTMGIRRFLDDENRWLSWTVYLPVRAENDVEKKQTVVKLLGIEICFTDGILCWDEDYRIFADGRINDFRNIDTPDDVIFDSDYFGGILSTSPAAELFDGCFYDDFRYEVEYVNACEYYGFERPLSDVRKGYKEPEPDTRTFNEKEVDYAFDVLRETAAAKGVENIMISPLSLQLCFALAANGAKGETLRGIEKLSGLTLEEMNGELAAFAESIKLTPDPRYDDNERFNVANSAWFKDNLTVNEDYLAAIKEYFGASSETVSFDETTVKKVNDWVDEETYGMIKKLFDEFPEEIAALLINAVAFEGQWADPFFEESTKKEEFLSLTGFIREVDMLNQTETMKYVEDDVFTGFVKPYTSHYAFVALLPKYSWKPERDMLEPYDPLDKLTAGRWAELMSGAITADVTVKIPKFKNEYSLSVTDDLLKDKPLPALFDPARADLSGMATSPFGNLYASTMEQATFIELDENGTRAAAVTYMAIEASAITEYPQKSVILDHPFIYAIIDTNTNIPIFVGTMTSPEA